MVKAEVFTIKDNKFESRFNLKEIPTTGCFILNESNEQYLVGRTLFSQKTDKNYYYFEQIVFKDSFVSNKQSIPCLLKGEVNVLTESQMIENESYYYPFLKLQVKENLLRDYTIPKEIELPYTNIRKFDFIKIDENNTAVILSVTVNREQLLIELSPHTSPIDLFQKNTTTMNKSY